MKLSLRPSLLTILVLCQQSIPVTAYNCDIAPLSLKIQNVSLHNDTAVNRGISINVGGNQNVGLRLSFVWNNTRIRSSLDCSHINVNSSQLSACQGASGSTFDPHSPGFNHQLGSLWDAEVETVDAPPLGAQIEQGVTRAQFNGGPSFDLPLEVWSSPRQDIDSRTPNKSFLALGPRSSVLERLIDSAHIPSRAFGLFFGSRSVAYPTDGELTLGGYDAARMVGPLMNYSIAAFPMNVSCPLRVQVRSVTLTNTNGSFEILRPGELVPACVEPLQNAFTFTEAMYSRWAELTNHSTVIDGEHVDSQTYLAENEDLMGTLTIGLDNGYNATIPHYELVGPDRGADLSDQGQYVVVNSSRIQSAVTVGLSDIGVDFGMILGGTFLSSTYLLVDYERNMFGLANANLDIQNSIFESVCSPNTSKSSNQPSVQSMTYFSVPKGKPSCSSNRSGKLTIRGNISIAIGIVGTILAVFFIISIVSTSQGENHHDAKAQGAWKSEAEDCSVLDRVKDSIQRTTSKPIIWWPLKPPRNLTVNQKQVVWTSAICSGPLSRQIPKALSEGRKENGVKRQVLFKKIPLLEVNNAHSLADSSRCHSPSIHQRSTVMLSDTFLSDANDHVELSTLPTWASSTSTLANSTAESESFSKPNAPGRSTRQYPPKAFSIPTPPGALQTNVMSKWVHWCVGTARTRVVDICVDGQEEAKNGRQFIKELKRTYRTLRGLRWWFSLKDCASIKFVKFAVILDDQDLVACSPEDVNLDEIRAAPKYEIDTDETIDDILHIAKVEETLTHLLQQHDSCVQDKQVNAIISGLPKERVDSLNIAGSPCKYGIRSIHGWSVMRMLCMFGLWIILGLIFFFVWLVKHPGDLQTASVPYLMLLTTFPIIIPVLDLYTE